MIWTFLGLGVIAYVGLLIEAEERWHPTPGEWAFGLRWGLRTARALAREEGLVDWARVGAASLRCKGKLEKDVQEVSESGALDSWRRDVRGLDISEKSWPWRAGYFEVLMKCAVAAEHLDGMLLDTTRRMVFPKDVVLGPSNPDPRPVPGYMAAAPREENCERPFEEPERFYLSVLRGRGFTTAQRLEAAGGLANWLEFCGEAGRAQEVYRCGVEIAREGLAAGGEEVMDRMTGVLRPEIGAVASENLLRATTGLAGHLARAGEVADALPIFLSVLRARRNAPVELSVADSASSLPSDGGVEKPKTDIGGAIASVRRFFRPPRFPPPPPSGDTPFARPSERPDCEDSELMLYIGEILFATSTASEQEGVGWTRQAVAIAEANLQAANANPGRRGAGRDGEEGKCKQCLITGVENWEAMLQRLVDREAGFLTSQSENKGGAGWLDWRSWFASAVGVAKMDIQAELEQVGALRERLVREGISELMGRSKGNVGQGQGMWIG